MIITCCHDLFYCPWRDLILLTGCQNLKDTMMYVILLVIVFNKKFKKQLQIFFTIYISFLQRYIIFSDSRKSRKHSSSVFHQLQCFSVLFTIAVFLQFFSFFAV